MKYSILFISGLTFGLVFSSAGSSHFLDSDTVERSANINGWYLPIDNYYMFHWHVTESFDGAPWLCEVKVRILGDKVEQKTALLYGGFTDKYSKYKIFRIGSVVKLRGYKYKSAMCKEGTRWEFVEEKKK